MELYRTQGEANAPKEVHTSKSDKINSKTLLEALKRSIAASPSQPMTWLVKLRNAIKMTEESIGIKSFCR